LWRSISTVHEGLLSPDSGAKEKRLGLEPTAFSKDFSAFIGTDTARRFPLTGDTRGDARRTIQRVAAAESSRASHAGRARTQSTLPVAAAANWRRRVAAMFNLLPSAKTMPTPGDRSARSMTQRRDWSSGGSMKTEL
jgi:hypothetical protein